MAASRIVVTRVSARYNICRALKALQPKYGINKPGQWRPLDERSIVPKSYGGKWRDDSQ